MDYDRIIARCPVCGHEEDVTDDPNAGGIGEVENGTLYLTAICAGDCLETWHNREIEPDDITSLPF